MQQRVAVRRQSFVYVLFIPPSLRCLFCINNSRVAFYATGLFRLRRSWGFVSHRVGQPLNSPDACANSSQSVDDHSFRGVACCHRAGALVFCCVVGQALRQSGFRPRGSHAGLLHFRARRSRARASYRNGIHWLHFPYRLSFHHFRRHSHHGERRSHSVGKRSFPADRSPSLKFSGHDWRIHAPHSTVAPDEQISAHRPSHCFLHLHHFEHRREFDAGRRSASFPRLSQRRSFLVGRRALLDNLARRKWNSTHRLLHARRRQFSPCSQNCP